MNLLAEIRWTLHIGDPDWLGWATAGGYLLCGLLCLWTARLREPGKPWIVLAAIYASLGVNKQLDLQTLLTAVGRQIFRDLGLYDQRRSFQIAFMLAVCLLAMVVGIWLWLRLSRAGPGGWLAALGAAMTISFVLIRAASFHHVDAILQVPLGSLPAKGLFENLGTFITLVGTGLSLSMKRPPPHYRVLLPADPRRRK